MRDKHILGKFFNMTNQVCLHLSYLTNVTNSCVFCTSVPFHMLLILFENKLFSRKIKVLIARILPLVLICVKAVSHPTPSMRPFSRF